MGDATIDNFKEKISERLIPLYTFKNQERSPKSVQNAINYFFRMLMKYPVHIFFAQTSFAYTYFLIAVAVYIKLVYSCVAMSNLGSRIKFN